VDVLANAFGHPDALTPLIEFRFVKAADEVIAMEITHRKR